MDSGAGFGLSVFAYFVLGAIISRFVFARKGRKRYAGLLVGAVIGPIGGSILFFLYDWIFVAPFHLTSYSLISSFLVGLVGWLMLLVPIWRIVETRMRRCPACHREILANARRCIYCKSDLKRPWHFPVTATFISGMVAVFLESAIIAGLVYYSFFAAKAEKYVGLDATPINITATPSYPTATPISTVPVVVAAGNLDFGAAISEQDVALLPWPAQAVPFYAVTDLNMVVGKIAGQDIVPGQVILRTMLYDNYYQFAQAKQPDSAISPPQGLPTPTSTSKLEATLSANRPLITLDYQQAVRGAITSNSWHQNWRFVGYEGETISLLMRASDTSADDALQPFIVVWSDDFKTWIDGQRGFGKGLATLTTTIPKTAFYIASASRARLYNGRSTGSYCLRLVRGTQAVSCTVSTRFYDMFP